MTHSSESPGAYDQQVTSDLPGEGQPAAISAIDPAMILAGIEQFGIAPDGSDLRDLASAIERLQRERDEARAQYGERNRVAIERAGYMARAERAEAELNAVSAAIGTPRFMDPPDGGDVSLTEQVSRMHQALDAAETDLAAERALREKAERERDEALAEIARMTPQFVAYEYLESPAGREMAEARAEKLETALHDLLYLHIAHHNHPVHAAARAALSVQPGQKPGERTAQKLDPAMHARTAPGPVNCNLRRKKQFPDAKHPVVCERCGHDHERSCPFFFVDGMSRDVPLSLKEG